MGFLLFILAYILILPMTIINFIVVGSKMYFRDTALSIDIFANREYRATWNKYLIVDNSDSYKFGKQGETISSVLGKNILLGALSSKGKALVWVLDHIQKDHCLNSINNNI